jgi:DNA-binding PadR family transcriptional regulator
MTEFEFQVLIALGDGPAHGYAIGKDIADRTGGRFGPTTGSLYQTLKRLKEGALVREASPPTTAGRDGRRRYFALTPAGRRAVAAEIARLEMLVAVGRERRLDGPRLR